MLELSFYHLPLHDKKLLQRWLVNTRQVNTHVNEHSRICSTHFERGKKQGKMLHPPYVFAWTKQVSATRAPPKERSTPVPVTISHSIDYSSFIPPENHMSTCTKCTKYLIISTTMDAEIMVKPAIVSAKYNTKIRMHTYIVMLVLTQKGWFHRHLGQVHKLNYQLFLVWMQVR